MQILMMRIYTKKMEKCMRKIRSRASDSKSEDQPHIDETLEYQLRQKVFDNFQPIIILPSIMITDAGESENFHEEQVHEQKTSGRNLCKRTSTPCIRTKI